MIARYASALTASTLITFALLFAMQSLIHLQPLATSEPRERHILDIWRPEIVEKPPQTIDQVIDPEVLKNAPLNPDRPKTGSSGQGFKIFTGHTGPGPLTTKLPGLSQPDGPLINIVRVQPTYPAAAEVRELQGWVDVRFDVTTDGRVVNIEVTESTHRVFEKPAIKAAQRFRFRAPVVNGVPQIATGIEYRFRFRMPD